MKDKQFISHLLKSSDIEAIEATEKVHFLNPQAIRHTKSLGDALGMSRIGVHLVRVEPGKETTEFHFHHQTEEFIYIISGRGIAEVGEEKIEIEAGDFMGFTAPSSPHCITNPFEEDLVYLVGGERLNFDVCDYPRLKKRLFYFNENRQLIDLD